MVNDAVHLHHHDKTDHTQRAAFRPPIIVWSGIPRDEFEALYQINALRP